MKSSKRKTPAASDDQFLSVTIHFIDGTTSLLSELRGSLTAESPYFNALVNFSEGESNAVEIKEIDRIGFDHVLNWFHGRHTKVKHSKAKRSKIGSNCLENTTEGFIRAYVVADRLMMNRFKDLALSKIERAGYLTTKDLKFAYDFGFAQGSQLTEFIEHRVAWDWIYDSNRAPHACEPDHLIIQGGEPAWSLVTEVWKAYNHTAGKPYLDDDQIRRRFPGSSGIWRLTSLQRCGEPANSPIAQARVQFTVSKLQNRTCRLSNDFEDFIKHGGLLAWEFVKLWVHCCRCQLRLLNTQGGCTYHDVMAGSCPAMQHPRHFCPEERGAKHSIFS